MGIASNLGGPVPISPLYGSLQSVVLYSCSLPGRLPPMAPMPLDLNQRHKSSEEYFNLYHSVIFLLQGGFNYKISPLSSDKAGPFPFLGFFLTAPSLQPVVLCRAENQLHLPSQSWAPLGRFCCCSTRCREPAELGHGIPTGTSTAVPHQHTEEDGETPPLIWGAPGGRPQLGHRQIHEDQQVSPAPQPSFLSLHCLNSPLGIFPTWISLPVKNSSPL